jgi:hypothetical protein
MAIFLLIDFSWKKSNMEVAGFAIFVMFSKRASPRPLRSATVRDSGGKEKLGGWEQDDFIFSAKGKGNEIEESDLDHWHYIGFDRLVGDLIHGGTRPDSP